MVTRGRTSLVAAPSTARTLAARARQSHEAEQREDVARERPQARGESKKMYTVNAARATAADQAPEAPSPERAEAGSATGRPP